MNIEIEHLIIVAILLLLIIILILIFKKNKFSTTDLDKNIVKLDTNLSKIDPVLRSEFSTNREEQEKNAKNIREEVSNSVKGLSQIVSENINNLSKIQNEQLEKFAQKLDTLTQSNEEKIEKLIDSNLTKQKEQTESQKKSTLELKNELKSSLKENESKTDKLITAFDNNSKELKGELKSSLKENESKTDKLITAFDNNSKELKGELKVTLGNNEKKTEELTKTFQKQISELNQELTKSSKDNRTELTSSLTKFEGKFIQSVKDFNDVQRQKFGDLVVRNENLKKTTEEKLDKISETVSIQLKSMSEGNMKKLEEMRVTVDEKLQTTLEKRFTESFTIISKRLEEVHKGLGEMQSLATNVGDLKKVMTNVKSRGIIGEYQLENLLEDLLTNAQYEKNVKTKVGSGAIVEFAIKMPNKNNLEKTLWLPIDSKFPKEDYEKLVDAYDDGDPILLETLRKNFKNSIIKNAKDIKEKYIDPPNTTEYALMFLPFESLYAEVLRTPGLFEELQKKYKITITGPTTLSALLNSLQMGFRTLAIEQRTSHVWDLLNVVKKEFGLFGTVLAKTKKKLQEASNVIDKATSKSNTIERQLKKVQTLSNGDSKQLESGDIFEEIEDNQIEDLDNDNVNNLFTQKE
ncbi:UNVERIFIED_CONTAM: hypothetical protein GTU68_052993 [Idotea baltica]|nr:hypothetical protein [Idotea baltica]